MCGRFSLTASPEEVQELLDLVEIEAFPPRYNIAPTQPVLMIIADPPVEQGSNLPGRKSMLVRWGLIPSWVKDPKDFPLLINARAETAAQKSSFRAAMRHRRTLIPASGFYEWKRDGNKKLQAYWIRPKDGGLVVFAGLMETWHSKDGSEIDTGAVLTTASNETIGNIHHRMPVVIRREDFSDWLNCREVEPREVQHLLQPAAPDLFEAVPVSPLVNKVANTGPEIQEPEGAHDQAEPSQPGSHKPDGDQMSLL
ncbi:MAG: SOS response-associated peptidase [Rhizobiaceae bacterium]